MKTRTLILVIIFLIVVSALFIGSSKKELTTEEAMETLSGTWVNEEYDVSGIKGKIVLKRDGTIAEYYKITGITPIVTGVFTIKDAWIDNKGNVWCKIVIDLVVYSDQYTLIKVTDSGTTWVSSMSTSGFSEKIDPTDIATTYKTYNRQ